MVLALEGIKVVETATVVAGPIAGRFLADWGADVIRVEHTIRGDVARGIRGSSFGITGARSGRTIQSDIDYGAENHYRNKRSITLNLSQEGGREVIYKLLEKADVFVSNFRPRELEKFQLEYETLSQLNPRLIQANVTSFGRKGPDKNAPGYDYLIFWARSGLLHAMLKPGMAPIANPVASGDRITGLALALGIMTALFIRERTGVAQEVDASLIGTGIYVVSGDLAGTLVSGQDLQQVDRKDSLNALGTFYQTKDGRWLRLGVSQTGTYWSRFCQALEREELEHDPRFESYEPRVQNHAALFTILDEAFLTRTLDEWKVRLTEAGLPWAPVQSLPEVIKDPEARANDLFLPLDHPTHGRIEVVANPVKLSKTPETIRMPAPEFGQHTEEILLEYGYSRQDIEQFRQQGIIV